MVAGMVTDPGVLDEGKNGGPSGLTGYALGI